MSDNKKYYYLKFKENYFDQDHIKVMEAMENGHEYSLIILKLYLKSLKFEGQLRINEAIPYQRDKIELLAKVLNHKPETVMHTVNLAKELGIIEILNTGEMFMSDIQNFIGESSTEGDRKRIYRQKLKQIEVDKCPTNRPPELEIESELELKKESYKEKKVSPKGDHQKIISLYKSLYENRFNLPVAIDNKERAAVKRLLSSYSAAEIEKNLKIYMASDDKFWLKQGLTLSYFQVAIKSLRVKQTSSKVEFSKSQNGFLNFSSNH